MKRKHPQLFKHKVWTPAELEKLSGLSPVALRDLRRRNIAPKTESRKLRLEAVAQLFLLSELTDHGFGPKSVVHISEQFADEMRLHALQHRCAWVDDASHAAWLKSSFGKAPKAKFILIERAGDKAITLNKLSDMSQDHGATVTLVDLEQLGRRLGEHLTHRASSWETNEEGVR